MACRACNQAMASEYDPMGTYEPEIIMNASSFMGYKKDGSPIYMTMAESTNPINLVGTAAFVAAGAALGWLLTGAVIEYLGK
jgi:hypothetical protein